MNSIQVDMYIKSNKNSNQRKNKYLKKKTLPGNVVGKETLWSACKTPNGFVDSDRYYMIYDDRFSFINHLGIVLFDTHLMNKIVTTIHCQGKQ